MARSIAQENLEAPTFPEALGQSEAFLEFQERLSRVARVDRPVLLLGERGTGKELAVRRLHFLSLRWQEPLVELNCAALSPSLIESELFGHEAGAFTGAVSRRAGRFESADGGTLFLDELGNLPLPVQEKILRVVEYGSFERVGGASAVRVDARIVGATNADLPALADEGRFMRDLLDRLSFEAIYVPPLRERHGDILLLADHFARRMAVELGWTEPPEFVLEVQSALESYPWRGNIRELKNVVERAVYRSESRRIEAIEFNPFRSPAVTASERGALEVRDLGTEGFSSFIAKEEVALLRSALAAARYNQRKAAQLLQLSYHQFRGLYRKYCEQLEAGPEG